MTGGLVEVEPDSVVVVVVVVVVPEAAGAGEEEEGGGSASNCSIFPNKYASAGHAETGVNDIITPAPPPLVPLPDEVDDDGDVDVVEDINVPDALFARSESKNDFPAAGAE